VEIPSFVDVRAKPFWYCRLDAMTAQTTCWTATMHVREMIEAVGDSSMRTHYRVDHLVRAARRGRAAIAARCTSCFRESKPGRATIRSSTRACNHSPLSAY
jgi:hypothetical protein